VLDPAHCIRRSNFRSAQLDSMLLSEHAGEIAAADIPRLDEDYPEQPACASLLGDRPLEHWFRQQPALDQKLTERPPGEERGIHTPRYRQRPRRT
jgi:hypothetical protein